MNSTNSALLAGKVVLVTGAARSLGARIVHACRADGATAIASDVLAGDDVVPLDVRSADDWSRVIDDVVAAHGRLDGLVNNAAVIHPARPFLDEPADEFAALLEVNLMGTWLGMQAAGRAMGRTGGGSIVNISSTAGIVAHRGLASYGASKWAIRGLTKYGAIDLGPDGVRVNSVHPGGMMGTTMFPGTTDPAAYEQAAERVPLRRVTDADDVAQEVVWLLSDRARQITGREHVVDAGATIA